MSTTQTSVTFFVDNWSLHFWPRCCGILVVGHGIMIFDHDNMVFDFFGVWHPLFCFLTMNICLCCTWNICGLWPSNLIFWPCMAFWSTTNRRLSSHQGQLRAYQRTMDTSNTSQAPSLIQKTRVTVLIGRIKVDMLNSNTTMNLYETRICVACN